MPVAPSVFPVYFSKGDTAAAPTAPTAPTAPMALNATPATPPTTPPKGVSFTLNAAAFQDTQAPPATPVSSTSRPTVNITQSAPPRHKEVSPTTSSSWSTDTPPRRGNCPLPSRGGLKPLNLNINTSPNSSASPSPPRHNHGSRSLPSRASMGTLGLNTFSSVNQRMALLERGLARKIHRLESTNCQQRRTIDYLSEEVERMRETIDSAPRAPFPMPIYDHMQAAPVPAPVAYPPPPPPAQFFQRHPQGYDVPPQNQGFWAPPPPPSVVAYPSPPAAAYPTHPHAAAYPTHRGPQPQPHPFPAHDPRYQHQQYPQQDRYNQAYPSPPHQAQVEAVEQYPVQYPSIAPGYTGSPQAQPAPEGVYCTETQTVCQQSEAYTVT